MEKLYLILQAAFCVCIFSPTQIKAQDCSLLTATCVGSESRCAATGSIKITASGGSGFYKYKATGPVNTNFTSVNSITGLPAGTYEIVVNDITTNCAFAVEDVVVAGNYQDPRFTLVKSDVTCDNGNNASISVTGVQFGRPPFKYSIVAPSPAFIGTSNSSGVFSNLISGDYSIQLTDSCGGIQTRQITVNNYSWAINSYPFTQTACDAAKGSIKVTDSKNNISTVGGIPGFKYGVVRFPGDTIWSSSPNISFDPKGATKIGIVVKDACGKIKKGATTLSFAASIGASVNTFNNTCNSFTASLTSIQNFYNPQYCLYDSNSVLIICNTSGTFTNLTYGSYCIKAHDGCTDTTITRCFTEKAPSLSVGNNVSITKRTCYDFTALINSTVGLTNPNFCLYDSSNILVGCNTTGIFKNLSYGSYCYKIKDGCIDTTITRCFKANRPRPLVADKIVPSYTTCDKFGVLVSGDSLTNPRFCLVDTNNVVIECNNTGVFDSIPFGKYCVNVYDSCYDTTIVRCFSVLTSYIVNDVKIKGDNGNCFTFTATATSSNIFSPSYCLYNNIDSLLGCNTTGIFPDIPYGSYCVRTKSSCPDTTFKDCFTYMPPVPSVGANVSLSNKNCNTFSVKITGQQNLTNPQYCLFNSSNVKVSCNTKGIFNTLAYGDYCIKITNSCYDTLITKCFNAAPSPVKISVSAKKSCSYGYALFNIALSNAVVPVNIQIYSQAGKLFLNKNYNSNSMNVDSIPELPAGQKYKVVVKDNCGGRDSVNVTAVISKLEHKPVVINKCPSGSWLNGSGSIQAQTATNMGSLTVRIIKKNGVSYKTSLSPNSQSNGVFIFNDLGPAKYIIQYKASDGCNKNLYDTVTIKTYQYPVLNRTSAYQCDVNGFTVGAVVDGGLAPFSYQIIGSSPATPSIITSPQTDPVFNINNGTSYNLIRLRVLDVCGNASLEDASVLPLANNAIKATFNCFQIASTLSVDSVSNATYTWYKKLTKTSKDSVLLGTGVSYFIPNVLPTDTGIYTCRIIINNGCIKRTYQYNLNGSCYRSLPVVLKNFSGKYIGSKIRLYWETQQAARLKTIFIERNNSRGFFTQIGSINSAPASGYEQSYNFTDVQPGSDKNLYRLKLLNEDNSFTHSNILSLTSEANNNNFGVSIYPNPASDIINIDFTKNTGHTYVVKLLNMVNQTINEVVINNSERGVTQIKRIRNMENGVYVIRIFDSITNESYAQKVIFR